MSRPKAHLGEIMGAAGNKTQSGKLSMEDLPDVLGEKLPDLPRNPVGRFRLVRALKNRFGDGFRNLPGVSNIIKEFDTEVEFEGTIAKMKKIKGVSRG